MEEAGVVLGTPAPEGSTALIRVNGDYIWSPLSPEDIDLAAGGDGQCPLEFFDTMAPEDGEWVGTVTDRRISQCPPGLTLCLSRSPER